MAPFYPHLDIPLMFPLSSPFSPFSCHDDRTSWMNSPVTPGLSSSCTLQLVRALAGPPPPSGPQFPSTGSLSHSDSSLALTCLDPGSDDKNQLILGWLPGKLQRARPSMISQFPTGQRWWRGAVRRPVQGHTAGHRQEGARTCVC